MSCNKSIVWVNDKSEIASLKSRISQLQYQIDSLRNAVTINNKLLLGRTDSLSLALTKANNTIEQSNLAVASIVVSLDSIKSQLKTTLTQITVINNTQTKTDLAISNNSTQLAALNQKYLDLQSKFTELQKKYEELYKLFNDYINSLKVAKFDDLFWTQVSTGYCWRVIPNLDSTVLFLSRATDVLKSTNFGVNFISTGFSFPVIRESLGTVSGGAYSNFNGGQLVIAGMDKGYYMSNDNAVSFSSTGPTGFGCGSPSILALNDGRFIASMGGFQRGIYKSSGTDNKTWVLKFGGGEAPNGIDPNNFSQNNNIIFSATTGTSGGNGGIVKSIDQGETWTNVLSTSAASGFIVDVEFVDDSLYFINSKGNFYVSNASSINNNILRFNFTTAGFVDCVYSNTYKIFVAVSDNSGVYISNNKGVSWIRYTIPGVTDYRRVSIIKNKIFVTTTIGLYVSSL
jgi:hypothetical protein